MAEARRPLQRMSSISLNVDELIEQLLSVRGRGPGAQVNLDEDDIRSLCLVARDVFLDQPCLLQLDTPIKICGDIHGQYHDLLRLLDRGGHPPASNYLFLGDYVDRGKLGLETICLLLCYKVKYPANFFLLRGNHESASINKMYGFYDECKRRYTTKLWRTFTDCFNCLPIAAIVDDKIFCAHGGLSPELVDMEQINRVARPTDVPDTGLLCDLLWSDPDRDIIGWGENDRGVSFTFGEDIVRDFLAAHDLDLICRAHQVVEDGYEFFAKRRLVTLFSAPNYCGEFKNAGAMMSVDAGLLCSFQILHSSEKKQRYQRKPSSASRGSLSKGPVGEARAASSDGASSSSSVVEDPLLAPPPLAAEDERRGAGDSVSPSHSSETVVPPPYSVAAAAAASSANGSAAETADIATPPSDGTATTVTAEASDDRPRSEYDSGPPAFDSLPGDHNRTATMARSSRKRGTGEKTASAPLFTGLDPTAAVEATASPTGGHGTTESLNDVGRIGGPEAGGRERSPVWRLPPQSPLLLSNALATRRLSDIDGVGRVARMEGDGDVEGSSRKRSSSLGGSDRPGRILRSYPERLADDWTNLGVGGGDRFDKARRRHWLATAASRRGDGRPASSGGEGSGGRLVPPSTEGNGVDLARSPESAEARGNSRVGGGGSKSRGVDHGGQVAEGAEVTTAGGGGGGGVCVETTSNSSAPTAGDEPTFSSLKQVPPDDGNIKNGLARRRISGGKFSSANGGESDLDVLSSGDDSAETSGTYDGGSDTSVDLNVDPRLTGGLGADWRESSTDADTGSSGESDEEEGGEEWGGGRSGRGRELEKRQRLIMSRGDPTTNGSAALRGEHRRATARARESASATTTHAEVKQGANINADDAAIFQYAAYGLATPPATLAGSDGPVRGSSGYSSVGNGVPVGRYAGADPNGRGGEKAGGKTSPVPVPIRGSIRPLDSMAELFVSHQLQSRRSSKEEPGAPPREEVHAEGIAPSSPAIAAAAAAEGGDNTRGSDRNEDLDGDDSNSPQTDVPVKGDLIHPNNDDNHGDNSFDVDELSTARAQSHTGLSSLDWSNRGTSDGTASDSGDVGRRRGRWMGKDYSQRTLMAWRRGLSVGPRRENDGKEEREQGLGDLDSSTRSSQSRSSITESETSFRRAATLLESVKRGASVAWSKVTADHPEPMPIDKSLTKEEWRLKHLQLEMLRRNDWRTNTSGEQHVLTQVLKQEEERVWN